MNAKVIEKEIKKILDTLEAKNGIKVSNAIKAQAIVEEIKHLFIPEQTSVSQYRSKLS